MKKKSIDISICRIIFFIKFLNKPSAKTYDADPLVAYFRSVINVIFQTQATYAEFTSKMETPRRKYLAALKKMEEGHPMYPDANSTMRCTYGTVIDYFPKNVFRGIPGYDLRDRKEKYYRVNIIPSFIKMRTPTRLRDDFNVLVKEAELDEYDNDGYMGLTENEEFTVDLGE